MSVLTLVRHGQASFMAQEYDQLSELGQAQATLLGKQWVRRQLRFDEVYTGPRSRQQQTAVLVGECYLRAGQPWPEPAMLPELDEYDLGGLMENLAPDLVRQNADFAALMERYQQSVAAVVAEGQNESERRRRFQLMFESLLLYWQVTPTIVEGVESWPAFRARVRRALDHILSRPGRGRRVAAFTSGGFIGTAVGLALASADRTALEMNWRLLNGSLTEFLFAGDRLTLDCFNSVPHLPDPATWTFR